MKTHENFTKSEMSFHDFWKLNFRYHHKKINSKSSLKRNKNQIWPKNLVIFLPEAYPEIFWGRGFKNFLYGRENLGRVLTFFSWKTLANWKKFLKKGGFLAPNPPPPWIRPWFLQIHFNFMRKMTLKLTKLIYTRSN